MCGAIDQVTRSILESCNPFDDVARPQQPDGRFRQIHVPAVLREPRERLLTAIDAYRVSQYASTTDLPASRVVKILGDRGSGKTHLYEAILYRDDGQHQLLISRYAENFDEAMPFEEYMFQLLMRALTSRHPLYGYRFFDALAAQLARKLLVHTLRELGPTDRLFVTAPSSWQRIRLLWRGGKAISQRFEDLCEELAQPAKSELQQICLRNGFDPESLGRLALARLARLEPGEDTLSIIRRELYGAMIRATLLGDRDALQGFLEADYQPASRGRVLHRADVVRQLLQAVREACALVQLPVVYAFDNLEGLLAPAGTLQPRRAAAFLDGLAQAVDHTRGFLFLLFFEQELYNQTLKNTGTFARSRLELGVQIRGRCGVAELELKPPEKDEICALVQGRTTILRSRLPNAETLPAYFPFSPQFIDELVTVRDQPIRGRLEMLRGEYNRLVFGGASPPPASPPASSEPGPGMGPVMDDGLERVWEESLLEAGRLMEVSVVDRHVDLTRGLSLLLQAALPWPENYPGLELQCQSLTIGDNPRHGFATLLRFKHKPARVAVGFLLATGKGMPQDLQAKFAAFSDDKTRANLLIVLWPTAKTADDLSAVLPEKTREVWDEADQRERTCLRAVEKTTLRKMLAFPAFPDKLHKQDVNVSEERLRSFVQERCAEIFPLVMPAQEGE